MDVGDDRQRAEESGGAAGGGGAGGASGAGGAAAAVAAPRAACFVHASVPAELAERCGARSLRYLLLLEEKLTDQLPCPSAAQVAAALADAGHEGHLLLDLLAAADGLGARAAHFVLDERRHGTQSLLSPALAPFQGPALCLYLPGVTLDAERVCRLLQPARRRRRRGARAAAAAAARGSRPCTRWRRCCIASGGAMYLFDPSGKHLGGAVAGPTHAATAAHGGGGGAADAAAGGGGAAALAGLGRAYPLVPNELPRRFPDQFAPLALFGFAPAAGKPMGGTLFGCRCARTCSRRTRPCAASSGARRGCSRSRARCAATRRCSSSAPSASTR